MGGHSFSRVTRVRRGIRNQHGQLHFAESKTHRHEPVAHIVRFLDPPSERQRNRDAHSIGARLATREKTLVTTHRGEINLSLNSTLLEAGDVDAMILHLKQPQFQGVNGATLSTTGRA